MFESHRPLESVLGIHRPLESVLGIHRPLESVLGIHRRLHFHSPSPARADGPMSL